MRNIYIIKYDFEGLWENNIAEILISVQSSLYKNKKFKIDNIQHAIKIIREIYGDNLKTDNIE